MSDGFAAFRHPGVTRLAVGRFASELGTTATSVAVGWQLYEMTSSKWALAWVGLVEVVPVVLLSLPAGIARMPLGRFTLMTTIGCIPWVWMLTYVGYRMGPNWEDARDVLHRFDYVVVAAVALGAGWLVLRRVQRRRAASAEA